MEKLKLIKPTKREEKEVMGFRKECLKNEKEIHGDGGLDQMENYGEWLEHINNESNGINLKDGWVPATTFVAIKETDNKVVGILQIRHKLNKFLLERGGNIGYEVRPSERRKGYATQMLGLALKECLKLGMKKVLVSCNKSNIASAKTIINLGGVLENEPVEENGNIYQRYWINII